MDYDLDEFLEEYDDFTQQVQGADYKTFPSRLSQWMHLIDAEDDDVSQHIQWLKNRPGADEAYASLVHFKSGMSASSLNIPTDRLDRLSAQLLLFSDLNSGKVKVLDFSYALFSDSNVNVSLNKMIDGLFTPFASEMRRYIKRNFDEPVPNIPASDRIVPLNHNAPVFVEIGELLGEIERDIRGINSVDQTVKDVALSELSATKAILDAPVAREDVIQNFLIPSLKWIALKFVEYGVNGAIGLLIAAILKMIS